MQLPAQHGIDACIAAVLEAGASTQQIVAAGRVATKSINTIDVANGRTVL